jgi:adenine-specific DNA-methyltransferase
MKTNFKTKLYDLLKKDSRLWDEEKKELNETLLKDLIDKLDEKLIELLLSDKEMKEMFFMKAKDVFVFKQNELKFFIDENKLDNSYTQYKNEIGLRIDNKLLSERDEVVLDWPFKDCILEGGMTKEDQKRKEIFFNEVLAKDEIDRLEDPKALVNWKRYTAEGEEKVKELKRDKDGTIRENLIIKGNNLLALHILKEQFAGKVKLIYIDPPYNTGNDSFKYNDNFNHSTWLTFMKNRLEIAKKLLSEEGTITISIDNKELSYIQILLDEIFGEENKKNLITIKRSSVSGAKVINSGVVNISEYVVVYSNKTNFWKPNRIFIKKERDSRYNKFIKNKEEHYEKWKYTTILEAFSEYIGIKKSKLKKELGESYNIKLEDFIYKNFDKICRFAALDDKAISKEVKVMKYISKKDTSKTFIVKRENYPDYYLYNGEALLFFEDRLIEINGQKVFGELVTDIWNDVLPNDLHNEGNVSLKKGKKPEKLLQRIIELFTEPNDILLDFFCGSGTTGAVAMKLNRQFIICEQLDYVETLPLNRLQNVIKGEQRGISKSVNWQGGGEFIYFELAKWNEEAKEKILKAKSLTELEKLFDELYERYFLNYNVKTKEFKDKILKEEGFKNLSLDEQKKLFVEMLDMNQMYVNFSERADKKYNLSEKDIKLSEEFYLAK